MKIAELWRYPVKSMAGEMLDQAQLDGFGIAGDRIVHIEDRHGRVITARTHPQLLGHRATLNKSGQPLIDGIPWTEPQAQQIAIDIVGPGAQLIWDESEERFDVLPLLVATDGAVAAFGHDRRRLRPNILISGVEGLAERSWGGHVLRIGKVLIGIRDLRGRCVMTTFDPDSIRQNSSVLAEIVQKFDGRLALNSYVICGGDISVGGDVELLDIAAATAQEMPALGKSTGTHVRL